jgi:sensor histidine kinase YesM
MAILASYMAHTNELPLDQYLNERVFKDVGREILNPSKEGVQSYRAFVSRFEKAMELERQAGKIMKR